MNERETYEPVDEIYITVQAGVLRKCEYHETLILARNDVKAAYKLGNFLYTAGRCREVFADRKQMTAAIKRAVDDSSTFECYFCERWLDD